MADGWEQRLVDGFSAECCELPADNDAEEEQTVKSTIKSNASASEVITDLALYISTNKDLLKLWAEYQK